MNQNNQITFNVAIVGDSNVGKTCLIKKLINKEFDLNKSEHLNTMSVERYIFHITKDGEKIVLNFIDTAGEELYHSLNWKLIQSACAFLIVFDLTDEVSFDDVIYWKDQIKEHVDLKKVDIIMVANKCDLERKVSTNRIENFEKKNDFGTNYLFFETSALTGEGINECLEGLVNKIMHRYDKLKDKKTINQNIKLKYDFVNNNNDLDKIKKKKKEKNCCFLF